MANLITTPVDPHAQQGVRNVMNYLAQLSGDKIVTGQHTQSMAMEEMHHIQKITGKLPALLGFELLS
ncbi:MAG: beta-mannosidase, partial [Clostridia bacterium]|nr:beta-mannosidase [Clostridia bacterium]